MHWIGVFKNLGMLAGMPIKGVKFSDFEFFHLDKIDGILNLTLVKKQSDFINSSRNESIGLHIIYRGFGVSRP